MTLNMDKFGDRTLYCDTCKKDINSTGVAPKCPYCFKYLIEIVYTVSGERITGKGYPFVGIDK